MLLKDFIKRGIETLEKIYPSPEARGMVLCLCEERLGVKNYTHIIEPTYQIPDSELPRLQADMDRLSQAEPLQYVLGYAEFCDRRFGVSSSVLIPRPETEQLVAEALSCAKTAGPRPRVLDLCTGSGCIAWTVALELPDSEVVAVDISEAALEVAKAQFADRGPRFVQADVLNLEQSLVEGQFDLLLSNPPYVKESEKALMRANVLDYEPSLALFVSDHDPLVFYRAIAFWANKLLKVGGIAIVEINEALSNQTAELFREESFTQVELLYDFCAKPRFVRFVKS